MAEPGEVSRFVGYAASLRQLIADELSAPGIASPPTFRSRRLDTTLPPVLLFSPHPDDESITGLLPLRLLEEEGRRVINVALTLGSQPDRREARAAELTQACDILGFELERSKAGCDAPERLKSFARQGDKERDGLVESILRVLVRHQPALVVYPHGRDRHPAHEGASRLLERALRLFSKQGGTIAAVETECWQPQPRVNLIVEGSDAQVGRLCQAIRAHHGEVSRNPYHVRQPIRMLENGFRASELVGGFGNRALPVAYCELYALFRYRNGRKRRSPQQRFCSQTASLSLDRLLAESFGGGGAKREVL